MMRYKLLGQSGLRVSELALGTMTFGTDWGWGADKDTSRQIFDAYVAAGGNFIDTACNYTNGTSERFVGEFIHDQREQFVVATKFTLNTQANNINAGGNHRRNIMRSVEDSLNRLNTDYIDLYYLHVWDFTIRPEEALRALDDLVQQGKIMYAGISDTPAWIVSRMNTIAELRGWSPLVAMQVEYSLIQRDVERELVPMAEAFGMSVLAWGILGGGALTGKFINGTPEEATRLKAGDARLSERNMAIAAAVVAVADEINVTPSQVAIAWLQSRPSVISILGARQGAQIADNLAAVTVTLNAENIARLEAISAIDLGFPHDFINREAIQKLIFGDHAARLTQRRKPL
ncbi:MAG: aldo/keto reductase [Phototrophicaceae bacterium]|jgi:aryl-alcohol dehydrogenase-like predicted oxidoreductase